MIVEAICTVLIAKAVVVPAAYVYLTRGPGRHWFEESNHD